MSETTFAHDLPGLDAIVGRPAMPPFVTHTVPTVVMAVFALFGVAALPDPWHIGAIIASIMLVGGPAVVQVYRLYRQARADGIALEDKANATSLRRALADANVTIADNKARIIQLEVSLQEERRERERVTNELHAERRDYRALKDSILSASALLRQDAAKKGEA